MLILALVPWLLDPAPSPMLRTTTVGFTVESSPSRFGLEPQEQKVGSAREGSTTLEGDILFRIASSFTYLDNDVSDSNLFRLETGLSYFLTNTNELGLDLRPGYQRVSFEGGGGAEDWFLRLGGYYHWNVALSPQLVAFVGPQVEWTTFDSRDGPSQSEFGYGFEIGARYWFMPNVALEFQPRYTRRSYGGAVGDENEIQTLLGLTLKL